jgi:hypothetical protein
LGTNTFCFTKLVDTALCHLKKIKVNCIKDIGKLKTNKSLKLKIQMWTNEIVPKMKLNTTNKITEEKNRATE